VIEEDDPFEDKVGLSSLLELQRNEPPTVQVPMEDFPNQLMRRSEEGWHAVEAKLTEIVQVQLPAPVDTRVGLPSRVPAARSAEEFLYRSSDKGIRCRDEADQGETVRGSRGRSDSIPRLRTLGARYFGQDCDVDDAGAAEFAGFQGQGRCRPLLPHGARCLRGDSDDESDGGYPVIEHELQKLRAEAASKAKGVP
jgi:hypothetical protein